MRVGNYQVDDVVAQDSRGEVYGATTPEGDRVAVAVFLTDDPDRFLAELEPLNGLAAFYTARVLDMGVAEGFPYVVTDIADGVALVNEVTANGPLDGGRLHRLAVATMTALAGLHQAGAIHGEFGPAQVWLGDAGPTVTGAGIGPAWEATTESATVRVQSPAFMAPERFDGQAAGPPADVFSWAATMVFAASGRGPFSAGSMAEAVNAVLNDDPDLGPLEEPLLGLASACLVKDPGARPTASEALMRLVGQSTMTVGLPEAPKPVAEPVPVPAAKRPVAALAAAGLALAVLAAGGGFGLARAAKTAPAAASSPAASATPALSLLAARPAPSPPPSPSAKVKATGIDLTLHENPADAVRLAAYRKGATSYLRLGAAFVKLPVAADPELSPDKSMFALSGAGGVTFTNTRTAESFTVAVSADGPLERPLWSRDGKRVLVSVMDGDRPIGFAVVDPAARTATVTKTAGAKDQYHFSWPPAANSVAVGYKSDDGQGVRFLDLAGRQVAAMGWVGESIGRRMFSPSGDRFMTICPSGGTLCVWDAKRGVRVSSVALFNSWASYGWYDDAHLIVADVDAKPHRVVAIDLRGKERRLLAEVAAKDDDGDLFLIYSRS